MNNYEVKQPNSSIPKYTLKEQDKFLSGIFNITKNTLTKNNLLWEKGILLLANQDGYVFEVVTTFPIPTFLNKKANQFLDFSVKSIGDNSIGLTALNKEPNVVNYREHYIYSLRDFSSVAIPIKDQEETVVAIIGFLTESKYVDYANEKLHEISYGLSFLIEGFPKYKKIETELGKKDALLTISQILYTTFDIKEVLSEAVKIINQFYPNDQLELLMTQDYYVPNAPIRQFTFNPSKSDISGIAFLEGRPIFDRRKEHEDRGEIAVPLKGKQGIYGVIHIVSEESSKYSEDKINFISNIASIISNAFENAKLYQQSNNLVNELKIINQLTKRLNESLNKDLILEYVIKESLQLFDANYICVHQVDNNTKTLKIIASNLEDIIGNVISTEQGYLGSVYKNHEPIIVTDMLAEQKTNDSFLLGIGCRSAVSVPILVNDDLIGLLTIASLKPHHFSYDNFRLLQVLAQHLGLTLTNAFLYEKIQQMAIVDYLTNLYNRSYLDKKIEESMAENELGAIILFDIDDFKIVNDTYGHQTGDKVLIQVANILKSSIRDHDIPARWGGEEIALYLPNSDIEIAMMVAERIRSRISMETSPQVTVSCGVASWNNKEEEISIIDLIRKADKALYTAKNTGKDRVIVFENI